MNQQFHSWVYIQKEKKENINSKRYMYPNAHSSVIYNGQDMEGIHPSTDKCIKKTYYTHTHTNTTQP